LPDLSQPLTLRIDLHSFPTRRSSDLTDDAQLSIGIDGFEGTRNSMPIYNMAWNTDSKFFWDGRANSIEQQALEPVTNPIEMHNTDRKSTRLNSSHVKISYAVFCVKKK